MFAKLSALKNTVKVPLPAGAPALGDLKSMASSAKNAVAKSASPSALLNTAKAAAGKVNVASMAKAAASGNVKGALATATNAAKNAATGAASNVALKAAASKVPGGTAAVDAAKKLGIPSATILSAIGKGPSILEKLKEFFLTMDVKTMVIVGGLLAIFILLLTGLILFFTQKKASNFQNVTDTSIVQGAATQDKAASIGAQVAKATAPSGKKEGFTDAADDMKLINIQPLTVKHAGFIGPLDSGVFQEATAVTNTLKAGIRTFVFQIDYHEDSNKNPKLFPDVKEPCLLFRDDNGVLTSTNAGSIQKMAQAIADIGFSNGVPSQNEPIVIVLYGLRTPYDPVAKPKEYLAYCSKIAKQLKPLAPLHLGLTTNGDYHRQALQGQLFMSPFKNFEKKVIIVSNFDTTLYRNMAKMGIPPCAPAEDLDYWTHAQLFKDDTGISMGANTLGVTSVAPTVTPVRAKIYTLASLKSVIQGGAPAMSAWATKNKSIFTVVMPDSLTNPSYTEIEAMIKTMGVNVVPLDIFTPAVGDTKRLVEIWSSKTWNLRPIALRASK